MEEPSFHFPPVPQLTGRSNLKAWKRHINQSCIYYDLKGFLLGTEFKPQDVNEVPRWRKRRVHCMALITNSLRTPEIEARLEMAGWKEDEEDPKVLYDLTISTILKIPERSIPELFNQLMDLKVDADTTPHDYITKLQEIADRLQQLGMHITDKIKILMTMRQLMSHYPVWHAHLAREFQKGTLTWEPFKLEVSRSIFC